MTDRPLRQRGITLSQRLRTETRARHDAVERRTGWPASIDGTEAYRRCLHALLSVWRPLDTALAETNWADFEVGRRRPARVSALERDLTVLGADPAAVRSVGVVLPRGLAARVGAFYVLEGSALGGRVIRADILRRLGPGLGVASSFFAGEAAEGGPSWRETVLAVDDFGHAHPDDHDAVVGGADATFAAFLEAFPLIDGRFAHPTP